MKSSWSRNLNAEQKAEMEREFESSSLLRRRLRTVLEDKIKESKTFAIMKNNYELASWPYLQADSVGFERALLEIISLLE